MSYHTAVCLLGRGGAELAIELGGTLLGTLEIEAGAHNHPGLGNIVEGDVGLELMHGVALVVGGNLLVFDRLSLDCDVRT